MKKLNLADIALFVAIATICVILVLFAFTARAAPLPGAETKLAMLRCHRSQLDWLKAHDGIDPIDMVETSARFRGFQ